MGRIICSMVIAVGLFVGTAAFAKVEVSQNGHQTIYDITIDGVDFKPTSLAGMKFVTANLMGVDEFSAIRYDLGKPELPVVRLMLDGIVSVEAQGVAVTSQLLSMAPIKPSQASWSKSMKFAPPVSYDAASYSQKYFSVAPPFEITPAGSVRGVIRNMVTLNALSYNPAAGSYQLRSKYRVTVENKQVDDTVSAPTIAYVVGARYAASPALNQLVQLKESQGFKTRKIIVGQGGVTTDVTIRAALKAIYAENVNLRFAILIGDVLDVPSHTATHISGVTDHFYRAIDTADYETDLNGPDIGVGRLSVASEEQLAVVVGKISRYTDGRFAADQWMQHPSFITTHDRYQVAEGSHNSVIDKYFAPLNYDRDFPDATAKGGDKLYPVTLHATPTQIVEHMNRGRFIVNFSGHGSFVGWEDVTTADVKSLNNPNALPWVIGNSCVTADFRQESVFGETWLRHPNGAIVYFGSMDSSLWDEDDILEKGMYKGVFEGGLRSFDLIHQAGLTSVWLQYGGLGNSAYYWETYVTLGDPSLGLRLGKSEEATVDGPTALIIGASEATWKISSSRGLEKFVRVTLQRNSDGNSETAVTNENGEVTLNLSNFGSAIEALTLTVAGGDLQSTVKPILMIAPNQAYLGFSNWQVNGRSNSDIHVAEDVRLGVTVENFGGMFTQGGRLRIVNISGPAVVTSADLTVPALTSRESKILLPTQVFTVKDTAVRGEWIVVDFVWDTVEGETGRFSKSWPVVRADILVEQIDYGDPALEGIGADGLVYLTIKNIGTEWLRSAELSGRAGACTTSVSGVINVPEIAPGASVRVPTPLHVFTDGQCVNGRKGLFTVEGTYQSKVQKLGISSATEYQVGVLISDVVRGEALNLPIPDMGAPVIHAMQVTGSGMIKDISVYVNIRHTYVGDLVIKLISPSGKEVVLQSRAGGTADVLDQRYGRGGLEISELATLVGTEATGPWSLSVQDVATSDAGTLELVELSIRHW